MVRRGRHCVRGRGGRFDFLHRPLQFSAFLDFDFSILDGANYFARRTNEEGFFGDDGVVNLSSQINDVRSDFTPNHRSAGEDEFPGRDFPFDIA